MNSSTPAPAVTGSTAITGSTGVLGGLVARQLAADGVAQRLVVRDLGRAPALDGAVAVQASYADAEASRRALDGVTTLLMVSAAENEKRLDEHRSFIAAATDAGVQHVVYTSFLGASPTATFTLARDHHTTEQLLRSSGMGFTFLRDSLYLDFMDALTGADGVIRGPAGSGRVGAVTRADVARAAVAVLADPAAHAGRTYELTGPEALTMAEIAQVLTDARGAGHPVSYVDETLEEAYASRASYGAPRWQVDAWVSTYTAIAAGELATVSGDVELLTGRRPLSLREYLAL